MFFKYYISTLLPPSQRVKKGENYTSHQQKLSTSWPHFSQNSPPLLNPPLLISLSESLTHNPSLPNTMHFHDTLQAFPCSMNLSACKAQPD